MLSKSDLLAIKTIVKDEISGVKKEVSGLKDDVSGLKNEFSSLRDDVSGLKDDVTSLKTEMKKNNDELIELITIGFNLQHTNFSDHEQRISKLEKHTFKSN